MKRIYLIILALTALFIAGCVSNQNIQGNGNTQNQVRTIEITSSGFSPKELTISQGETVTWINRDLVEHWPASAMHPTHTVYPGSDIQKCRTAEQSMIFDACKGLAQGESWSFTFNEIGTWNYHDHLVTGLYGKIIVTGPSR